jgi:hypothetical protein
MRQTIGDTSSAINASIRVIQSAMLDPISKPIWKFQNRMAEEYKVGGFMDVS